jgi:hypothetical protein
MLKITCDGNLRYKDDTNDTNQFISNLSLV